MLDAKLKTRRRCEVELFGTRVIGIHLRRSLAAVLVSLSAAGTLTGCSSSTRPVSAHDTAPTSTAASSPAAISTTTISGAPGTTTSLPPTTTSPAPEPAQPASGVVVTGVGWSPSGLEGPMPAPGACHYVTAADGYALPDPACTPGAVDTAVTQANIRSTICSSGFASSLRPP
ncbi:MAG: hypothetical protein ACRDV4_09305, partial [Acidimicrobiales bacterium]